MKRAADRPTRVLVVDDNAFVRKMIVDRLGRAGCVVEEANDGAEALDLFAREPAQVVITDINMPRLRGLELLASLRREPTPPEVILLTGTHAGDAAAAVQALRLGAHDYIAKDAMASEAVVLAVERAVAKWRLREENARLLDELRSLSLTDGLTGAGNRRAFDEGLLQEVARARRGGGELSLALFDIDHFKRVNDSHGHVAGDAVIVDFAARVRSVSRESDRLFRYGGEEFAMLLGSTGAAGALKQAQRVVTAVAAEPMRGGALRITLTCSAGTATLLASDGESGAGLVRRADAALYAAKGAGRNRALAGPSRAATLPSAGDVPQWELLVEDRC
jgi:two-component system, cell cycle response regulator